MLTNSMADAYRSGTRQIAEGAGVKSLLATSCEGHTTAPHLFDVSASDWLGDEVLAEEVFGPLGLMIRVKDAS